MDKMTVVMRKMKGTVVSHTECPVWLDCRMLTETGININLHKVMQCRETREKYGQEMIKLYQLQGII